MSKIRTVGDVRDERAARDAIDMSAERVSQIKYLRECRNIAIRGGWVEVAARYSQRIEVLEGGAS